ncbi:putative membrane protein [Escherichia coli 3-073-06_S4_C1]|nr:putative membrane protein [Escherichia coli 3-073-06_S4_C1]KDU30230.1 putative membrane protein [Escherichia coli 3-073-06_S4_C1]
MLFYMSLCVSFAIFFCTIMNFQVHVQEIEKPDDTAVHALCHVSLSAFPTTPVVSLSAWSIFIP